MALAKIDRPVSIRQTILAGNDFTGVAPETAGGPIDPTFEDDIFKLDSLVLGGLFDLPSATAYSFEPREALLLIGVELHLSGPTGWSLDLIDVDSKSIVLWNGTGEDTFVVTEETRIMLPWGSQLSLTTSGASLEMVATLKLAPARLYYRE